MKKKVSIIIPVFNVEKYLDNCVNSILNQSYQNIEIILVNDGSTDNSLQICNDFSKKHSNIIVINQKNGGPSVARNAGIKKSTGDFILFVDSDDFIDYNMIEEMVNTYNKQESDIIVCGYKRLIYKNKKVKYIKNSVWDENVIIGEDNILNYYYPLYDIKGFNSPCGKMYDANIIKKHSIFFESTISIGEDYLFNLKYINYVKKLSIINLPLYNYRIEFNFSTNKYEENLFRNRMLLWDETYKFFVQKKLPLYALYKLYIKFVYSQIIAFNHKNCKLNTFGKNKIIDKMVLNNRSKIIFENIGEINGVYRILGILLKFNNKFVLLAIGKILYIIKKIKG